MDYLTTIEEPTGNEATYTVSGTSIEERVQQLENTVNKLIELLGEKMNEKSYSEEIYPPHIGIEVRRRVEEAYEIGLTHGKEQSDNLEGFSNLTQAVQDGTRIDWEKLDGRAAKCVHPEIGVLTQKMELNKNDDPSNYLAWTNESIVWEWAFELAWQNASGWSLWVEGDITLNLHTSRSLKPGTVFKGQESHSSETKEFVIIIGENGKYQALERYSTRDFIEDLDSIDVIEVISGGFVDE